MTANQHNGAETNGLKDDGRDSRAPLRHDGFALNESLIEDRGEGALSRGEGARISLLPADILNFARELRRNQTDAESLLWSILRNRRFGDFKFRRQHPLGRFILDFYCHDAKLSIELDGGQHNTDEGRRSDETRTQKIASQGIRELRFWNYEVLQETESVLEAIWNALHSV